MSKRINGQPNESHGMTKTPEYRLWEGMRTRCNVPSHPSYLYYGARGIKVCERWESSFAAFFADMGPRPEGMTLDRYPDPKGNYEPGNCRWATLLEQGRNRTVNVWIEAFGRRQTLTEWSRETGLKRETISTRINKFGLPPEVALQRRCGLVGGYRGRKAKPQPERPL